MDKNSPTHDSFVRACEVANLIKIVDERSIRCYIFLQGRIVGGNDVDNQSNTVTWSE